uniref:Uncharacterized protein n=1 Tax=Vespula pensylvanica TaxID=30213 RepID=A0A834P759_VESPE|nr:hypothetical protein H0235_004245 [Vespula pensylvanica]
MSDHEDEEARDNNWFVHSAARPLRPMNVFVEITRNGCKCQESFGSSERMDHYLATAVTTAQRLMHTIVASLAELVRFRPRTKCLSYCSECQRKIDGIDNVNWLFEQQDLYNNDENTRTPLKRWRVIKRNEAHHANGCCCTIIDFTTWTRVSKSVLIKAIATCVSASNAERKGLCVDESAVHTALEDSRRTSLP